MKQPEITFISGLMKGGKSAYLIDAIDDSWNAKYPVLILKPSVDTRDGAFISSRARTNKHQAVMVDENNKQLTDLVFRGVEKYGTVFIDEVQFFSKEFVKRMADYCYTHGADMIVAGLTYDVFGNKFPSSWWLEENSDVRLFMNGKCDCCGKRADKDIRTVDGRVDVSGDVVIVEGADKNIEYLTVCNKCHHDLFIVPNQGEEE
jgi:thymidine kinase